MRKYSKENAEIGARVRAIRQGAGLTQEQFSERIAVTATYISELERGLIGISASTVKRICLTFGVSCDQIILGLSHEADVTRIAEKIQHLTVRCRLISPSVAADPDELLRSVFDRCLSQGWKWF